MDKRNDDGDVICNIYCKTQYGGITYEINYPFFIRTYPDQPKIDILDVKVQDAQSCTLTVGFHAWDAETYTIKIIDTNRDNTWEDNLEDNINNSYTTYTFDKIYIDTNYEITVWGFNGSKILMTQTLYFRMNDHMGIEKIEQDEFIESGTIFNLQGQIIGRFTENHRDIFTELQPGIYIINGLTSTGEKVNRKIIVKSPSSPI